MQSNENPPLKHCSTCKCGNRPVGWTQREASGGKRYINRPKNMEIFIDLAGDARIMFTGSGYWLHSIQRKKGDTFETIAQELLTLSDAK